jgi:ribosomal protein S18 acetylase RimI-like enzyme
MPTLVRHYKRYRMERPLTGRVDLLPPPAGFFLVPWDERLVDIHGDVKYRSFVDELDTALFPNLASVTGCRLLMRAIRDCFGFCPCATWMVAGPDGYCGTVQGVLHPTGVGVIQNLGVTPECRGLGLGAVLLAQAVAGFALSGARVAALDVTAENTPAVRLYRKFGFRATKTTYLSSVGV